ncbi:MAG: type III pantothenate kinase [Ruminiclostridium sp.]|nr:type III pantothenate kinase [Ruminiclostridium sp.]MCI9467173.1 type III pantothenate kinase [Ruminiclostridium sp.]
MLLAIDVGNTNMVFGLLEGDKLLGSFRLMTDANKTSDEIGLTVCEYFRRFDLDMDQVCDIIVASVVPQVMYTLTNAIAKYFGKRPIIVDEDVSSDIHYEGDERLGSDRAVACVAAIAKYGKPLVVLDFGTATTVDAVNHQGTYLGGCILAGLRVSTDALFQRAAMLPRIELDHPGTVLGQNTVSQIQAGSVVGYIGAIEYLIRQTKEEMGYGPDIKVVATGGLARLIADNTDLIDVVDSQLILDGLRIIYERYKNQEQE